MLAFSGAAFAKPATPPAKPKPPAMTQPQADMEGTLESIDAKSVTIKQNKKIEKFELAKNVTYSPNRKALKNGSKVKLVTDKEHHVTAISQAG